MERLLAIQIFSQRRHDAHQEIQLYARKVVSLPYATCLNGNAFTVAVAKYTVASDVIAVLDGLQSGDDVRQAIVTELKASLRGKIAIGPETNMHAMMLRLEMIEVISETLKYVGGKNA